MKRATPDREGMSMLLRRKMMYLAGCAFADLVLSGCGESVAPIAGTKAFVPCGWTVEQVSDTKAFALLPREGAGGLVFDGVATFSIENLSGRKAVLDRLVAIAAESSTPPRIQLVRGWPGLSRRYVARVDGENERRIGPRRQQWIAVTTAVAAGNQLIRVEARISPERGGETSAIASMGLSFNVPSPPSDPQTTQTELEALKRRTAVVLPAASR